MDKLELYRRNCEKNSKPAEEDGHISVTTQSRCFGKPICHILTEQGQASINLIFFYSLFLSWSQRELMFISSSRLTKSRVLLPKSEKESPQPNFNLMKSKKTSVFQCCKNKKKYCHVTKDKEVIKLVKIASIMTGTVVNSLPRQHRQCLGQVV